MTLPSRTVPDLECQLNWDAVQALLPGAGEVRMWALPTAPTGWAVCDGSVCPDGELRRKLLAAGSPHGVSGALPLLPDMRGRVPIGVGTGSGLTARTLGTAYGAETHQLTAAESGVNGSGSTTASGGGGGTSAAGGHSHSLSGPNSDGTNIRIPDWQGAVGVAGYGGYIGRISGNNTWWEYISVNGVGDHSHTIPSHSHPLTARSADAAHNNVQPSRAINFIIKT